MLFVSLTILLLACYGLKKILAPLKLPNLVSYLIAGMIVGPFGFNWLSESLQEASPLLRTLALIIILVRAGLSLNVADLKELKRPMFLMAFMPALFEIAAYTVLAPLILKVTTTEAFLMGTVLAAVSPAVVVPRMIDLMDKKLGTAEGVPALVLASASLDDIVVLVLFSSAMNIEQSGQFVKTDLLKIPLTILMGVLGGLLIGNLLAKVYPLLKSKLNLPQAPITLITFAVAYGVYRLEDLLEGIVPFSGLLAVMTLFIMMNRQLASTFTDSLSRHYNQMWKAGEMILFGLVGALVNIPYALKAGPQVLLLIVLALVIRIFAVWLTLLKTPLSSKERAFICMAYLPKATVQAAIGGVPLAAGLESGQIILSTSVWGILLTAPLGAIAIDRLAPKLLKQEQLSN